MRDRNVKDQMLGLEARSATYISIITVYRSLFSLRDYLVSGSLHFSLHQPHSSHERKSRGERGAQVSQNLEWGR